MRGAIKTQLIFFVFQVDNIILRANKMANNGKMGDYVINGRTKVTFLVDGDH